MIPVHVSVMPDEVMEYLVPSRPDALVIDGTLGEGGHSQRFLETYPDCRLVGVDADVIMGERASERLAQWKDRFDLKTGWTDEILDCWSGDSPDLILMDLGISTFHYDGSGRGFSFKSEEPLDMRLDEDGGNDAAELVNTLREEDLADLIFTYGEERFSRRIARRIVEERKKAPIRDSSVLAGIVARAVPSKSRHGRIHAATRTFQALRIAVNSELDRLSRLLETAPGLLAPGGRLGIISFHSLEDRLVKRAFRALDIRFGGTFNVLTRKPLVPSDEECRANPPSRSAKFRVIEKPLAGADR
ncbi:MAG: 16S rRNA (cytosine(1402)-N(4))-methyltransferase RsmH [Spirochaetaceae bacterium]|nr:16S rRNA (cytosine(1402)-N(4))-methyltransferase RsmH [Spirochaetaceae bacterium]